MLDSIVSAQLEIANAFIENSDHVEQEILPEISELKDDVQRDAMRLQSIGDAVISELKQSEIEIKTIWGKRYEHDLVHLLCDKFFHSWSQTNDGTCLFTFQMCLMLWSLGI